MLSKIKLIWKIIFNKRYEEPRINLNIVGGINPSKVVIVYNGVISKMMKLETNWTQYNENTIANKKAKYRTCEEILNMIENMFPDDFHGNKAKD